MSRRPHAVERVATGASLPSGWTADPQNQEHPSPPPYAGLVREESPTNALPPLPQDDAPVWPASAVAPSASHSSASSSMTASHRPAPPTPQYNPVALAQALYEGLCNDQKDEVVRVLCKHTPDVVATAAAAFEAAVHAPPHKFLRGRLGGADRHFVSLMEALAAGSAAFDAMRLRESLYGVKITHLTTILPSDVADILAGRPTEDIRAIRAKYKALYGEELSVAIYHRLAAPFRDLMGMVVNVDRRSPGPHDAKADADALYDAGEGRPGTEVLTFFEILTDRTPEHIKAILSEYELARGKSLEAAMRHESFGGDSGRALLLIIRSAQNRVETVVDLFSRALSVHSIGDVFDRLFGRGSAADDGMLVRLMVEYRDPRLRDPIKKAYWERHRVPLSTTLRKLVQPGDYLNALLACLGEA